MIVKFGISGLSGEQFSIIWNAMLVFGLVWLARLMLKYNRVKSVNVILLILRKAIGLNLSIRTLTLHLTTSQGSDISEQCLIPLLCL